MEKGTSLHPPPPTKPRKEVKKKEEDVDDAMSLVRSFINSSLDETNYLIYSLVALIDCGDEMHEISYGSMCKLTKTCSCLLLFIVDLFSSSSLHRGWHGSWLFMATIFNLDRVSERGIV